MHDKTTYNHSKNHTQDTQAHTFHESTYEKCLDHGSPLAWWPPQLEEESRLHEYRFLFGWRKCFGMKRWQLYDIGKTPNAMDVHILKWLSSYVNLHKTEKKNCKLTKDSLLYHFPQRTLLGSMQFTCFGSCTEDPKASCLFHSLG